MSRTALNAKAFDMFCSIRGLSYGLRNAGITISARLDVDGSCRYAYKENCKANFIEADIRDISFSHIAKYLENTKYRILVGCAPCQPFSPYTAKAKSSSSDSRSNLINEFLRVILEGKPDIVSMENVPRIMGWPVYIKFKHALADAGYEISDGVVSCAKFDVPQTRRRLVLVASLLGKIGLPVPESPQSRTVRQAIGKLMSLEHGGASPTDPLHACAGLEPTNLKRIRASSPGGSWQDWPDSLLPNCYRRESGSSYTSVYGRMCWDRPAPTMTTQFYRYGTGRFGHPEQDRALSLREGALLQTFPDHYQFLPPGGEISFSRLGRHIGNAVPPSLAAAIGKAIIRHLVERE